MTRVRDLPVYFMAEYTSFTGLTWRKYADAAGNCVSVRANKHVSVSASKNLTGQLKTRAQTRAEGTAELAARRSRRSR